MKKKKKVGAYGTRCSQAVTHPSTDRARRCLTSVFGREPVFSTWYGCKRWQRFVWRFYIDTIHLSKKMTSASGLFMHTSPTHRRNKCSDVHSNTKPMQFERRIWYWERRVVVGCCHDWRMFSSSRNFTGCVVQWLGPLRIDSSWEERERTWDGSTQITDKQTTHRRSRQTGASAASRSLIGCVWVHAERGYASHCGLPLESS